MKKIAVSDVPAKILKALDEAVPGGKIKEAEKGVIYEIEKIVDDFEYDITITEGGNVVKVDKEQKLALSAVPDIIIKAADKAVPGGKINEVHKAMKEDVIIYEVEKIVDGVENEILITEDGTVKKVKKG